MSTPEIQPATDEQIADYRTWNLNWLHHPKLAVSTVVSGLLARIESDRATIAELLAACEDLSERLTYVLEADEHGPDLCDADEGFQTRRCENDGCLLHAVKNAAFAIAKAKESR